jgi:superfamily II DNA or RNA helicase
MVGRVTTDGSLADAKALIAAAVLEDDRRGDERLGRVTLRPHQRVAAKRIRSLLRSHGGAVLADDVGLGKTYVCLAVARPYHRVAIVAPAVLREMWNRASSRAAVGAAFVSMESLSRGRRVPESDIVIVDEAHHFRSPTTRRYAALAAACRSAPVVLATATPIHNSRDDLAALASLFLGQRARSMPPDALAALLVRRGAAEGGVTLPVLVGPHALSLPDDAGVLDRIERLPSPVGAHDEGSADALVLFTLVHRWSSSHAALVASLRRRRARAAALAESVAAGRHPSRDELTRWLTDGGAIQLGFAELLSEHRLATVDVARMLERLTEYLEFLEPIVRELGGSHGIDDARVARLREVRALHPTARVIAFSQYAETVQALGARLLSDSGVAAMTADGARIASGTIARREVIAQFRPLARVRAVERIDLLLTTDVLSEGVDLHDASVVVHLDLPWNPARIAQRVGRVRRLGSPHTTVWSYVMLPPASAARLIDIERRLQAKLAVADRFVGVFSGAWPFGGVPRDVPGASTLLGRLASWSTTTDERVPPTSRAGCVGSRTTVLAAVRIDGEVTVVASDPEGFTDDPAAVIAAIDVVDQAAPASLPRVVFDEATARLRVWAGRRRARNSVTGTESSETIRRRALQRIDRTVQQAPRHERASLLAVAQSARVAVAGIKSAGAERDLADSLISDDGTWLRRLATTNPRQATKNAEPDQVIALIVVAPNSDQSSSAGA